MIFMIRGGGSEDEEKALRAPPARQVKSARVEECRREHRRENDIPDLIRVHECVATSISLNDHGDCTP